MKTRFKIAAVVIAMGLLSYVQMLGDQKQSNLSLMNVEALARGESGSTICLDVGCVNCPINGTKVYLVLSR